MIYSSQINLSRYQDDIVKCFTDNKLIFDSQHRLNNNSNKDDILNYVYSFIQQKDCLAYGLFDNNKQFLYGLVLFENMRFGENANCAQAHIALSKLIWGETSSKVLEGILKDCIFDVVYCQIPSRAVPAIRLAKKLGFKKTGYVPKCIPYVNSEGREILYDLYTLTWRKCKW